MQELFAILQKYDFSSKSQLLLSPNLNILVVCDTAKVRFFKQITTSKCEEILNTVLFAILQKYDFSSKSQRFCTWGLQIRGCLRYCKSTIFQANHNLSLLAAVSFPVVCDTAKVRFFKQITTLRKLVWIILRLFAILQKYDFSSKSQHRGQFTEILWVVCDTAKVRFFKQITTSLSKLYKILLLFAILQKYDFSSKSQLVVLIIKASLVVCDTAKVRFFKQITTSTIRLQYVAVLFAILQKYDFSSKSQQVVGWSRPLRVVCDTAKVRFFKQITTAPPWCGNDITLFAILQKYDFSSKSQPVLKSLALIVSCLRYCKSTIFQANHNPYSKAYILRRVVCDTAKVRFFKQITTDIRAIYRVMGLFAILQKYDFSSKSQPNSAMRTTGQRCLRYCKSTIFQANHNASVKDLVLFLLFAILQKYDFSSKSQRLIDWLWKIVVVCDTAKVRFFKQITTIILIRSILTCCLRYCKSTIFQANHNMYVINIHFVCVVCDTAKVRFFKQITTPKCSTGQS